mmetsp:Transcript_4201/g.7238  ORF Transcript_4201/g.7238 Transcript_4201/m.7238 type:complete len:220 (-) Transcript_4201:219-878(-)
MQIAKHPYVQAFEVENVGHLIDRVPFHRACPREQDSALVLLSENVDLNKLLRGAMLQNPPAEATRLLEVNRVPFLIEAVVGRGHASLERSKLLVRQDPPEHVVDVVLLSPLLHGGDPFPRQVNVKLSCDQEPQQASVQVSVHYSTDGEAAVFLHPFLQSLQQLVQLAVFLIPSSRKDPACARERAIVIVLLLLRSATLLHLLEKVRRHQLGHDEARLSL